MMRVDYAFHLTVAGQRRVSYGNEGMDMGATGWEYFAPYQANVAAVLQRLRECVFAEGGYLSGVGITRPDMEAALKVCGADTASVLQQFAAQASDPKLPAEARKKFTALVQQLKRLGDANASLSKPRTIEDLLERQAASGTHSILDIVRVPDAPEFGAINPLPTSEMSEIFGTEKPSRAQIERKHQEGALEEFVRQPWQGIYIVAYREGLPDEIFFAGCSGD
jgi:hypothetical protein